MPITRINRKIGDTAAAIRREYGAAPHPQAIDAGVPEEGSLHGLAASRMREKHTINLHWYCSHSISPWVSDLLQKSID
jgi:hypothetical protein